MNNRLKEISTKLIDRYSTRYGKLGKNVKTLGWGSEEQQFYRFKETLTLGVDFKGNSILDIGCGFGDYYNFLKTRKNEIVFQSYLGYDINEHLIKEAHDSFIQDDTCTFEVFNILEQKQKDAIADIGIMLGVLNLNFKKKYDNYDYSKKVIKNAFALVKECLIVDFLSTNLTPNYPKEDFVFYHDPLTMLEFAFTLSSSIVLKHDYAPIPQKEFMLAIYK